jgi:hypothetical protein
MITQEDLLCDPCRAGGCAMRYRGTLAGWQYHTHVAWEPAGDLESMLAADRRLQVMFPEGSWITDDGGFTPLHLADAAGRPYLNPDVPRIPHGHNGVPCPDVPG